MTRKEAIKILKDGRENLYKALEKSVPYEQQHTLVALDMAIKVLEQQPCEDCVSRKSVIDALDNHKYSNEFCEEHHIDWSINLGMAHIVINELPSVTPQEKTGHWIMHPKDVYAHLVCDKCLSRAPYDYKTNFCPICGAKMQEKNNEICSNKK